MGPLRPLRHHRAVRLTRIDPGNRVGIGATGCRSRFSPTGGVSGHPRFVGTTSVPRRPVQSNVQRVTKAQQLCARQPMRNASVAIKKTRESSRARRTAGAAACRSQSSPGSSANSQTRNERATHRSGSEPRTPSPRSSTTPVTSALGGIRTPNLLIRRHRRPESARPRAVESPLVLTCGGRS